MLIANFDALRLLCLTLFVGILAASSVAAQGQAERHQAELDATLREILHRQAEAWNQADHEQFMDGYWRSDELTFSSGGKTTRGWQATLERYRKMYPTKKEMGVLQFSELEVTPLGPDAALMLGRFQLTLENGAAEGNFSLVWRRFESGWKIIHDHSSALQPEPAAPSASDR
jgi:beta-aspartyl-peptidase (threonine type)